MPCDAIRCDARWQTITATAAKAPAAAAKAASSGCEVYCVVSSPFLCPILCPIVCLETVFVLSDCATTAELLLHQQMPTTAKPCHAMPWVRGKWEECSAVCPPTGTQMSSRRAALDEANCPSGIVYRADGSRLLPGPPMQSNIHIPGHATADPKCNVQGALSTARCERQVFVSSPFAPHCTTRNGMKIAPSCAPLFLFLGTAKVCLSCPPSLTYTLLYLPPFLALTPSLLASPSCQTFWFSGTPDGLYLSTPSLSLSPQPLQPQYIHSFILE